MPCSRASTAIRTTPPRRKSRRGSAPTTWRPRNGSCAAGCRRWKSSMNALRVCCAWACSTFLRRSAEVSVGSVRVSKYSEFIRNLVVPTNLNLVHMKPLRGTALIVFDPGLVFLLVDNLFGGDGRFPYPRRGPRLYPDRAAHYFAHPRHRVRGLYQVVGTGVSGRVRVHPLRNEYPVRQHRHAERGGGVIDLSPSSWARSAARFTSACPTR